MTSVSTPANGSANGSASRSRVLARGLARLTASHRTGWHRLVPSTYNRPEGRGTYLPLLSRPFSFWFSFAHRQPDDEAGGKRAGLTTMADDGQASRALWSDLPPELLAQSVSRLSQWQDVVAVAGTCRTWRRAAKQALAAGTSEPTDVEKDAGSEVAFEWSDWETLDESIASTSRRRSLESFSDCTSCCANGTESPRTPSPEKTLWVAKTKDAFDAKVSRQFTVLGHLLRHVSIVSFSLDDAKLHHVLSSCPNLRCLRIQHICSERVERGVNALAYPPIPDAGASQDGVAASEVVSPVALAKVVGQRNRLGHVKDSLPCGCAKLKGVGFMALRALCPMLVCLDLSLEHVFSVSTVDAILAGVHPQLGTMRRLSIHLKQPSFANRSIKQKLKWQQLPFFNQAQVAALVRGAGAGAANDRKGDRDGNPDVEFDEGPYPLEHLSLSPWRVTDASLQLCCHAFPNLRSLSVESPILTLVDGTRVGGFRCNRGVPLRHLRTLRVQEVYDLLELCYFIEHSALGATLENLHVGVAHFPDPSGVAKFTQITGAIGRVSLSWRNEHAMGHRQWRSGIEVLGGAGDPAFLLMLD